MKFALTQESNLEQEKINLVTAFSQDLKKYFESKSYGGSVEEFLIGIICVKPEFEQFFKVRKPKYIESKTETHEGFSVEIKRSYSYDIKLEYEKFYSALKEEIICMLAFQIIASLAHLNSLPKKIKDFDKERFESDLESYFKERDLI